MEITIEHEYSYLFQEGFSLQPNMQVSNRSYFGDRIWDFNDDRIERLNSLNASKLIFNWEKMIDEGIDKDIIYDLKVLSFFYLKVPVLLGRKRTQKEGYKPSTIIARVETFKRFLLDLKEKFSIDYMGEEKLESIINLSDITISEINSLAGDKYYAESTSIAKVLSDLSNKVIKKHLTSKISWSSEDIKNIEFIKRETDKEKDPSSTLPIDASYFQFISRRATIDIITFLKLLGLTTATDLPSSYKIDNSLFYGLNNVQNIFEEYVKLRREEREMSIRSAKRTSHTSIKKVHFRKKYNISAHEFYESLKRVRKAAQYLILQYTGVRYSEAISFKKGCIKKVNKSIYVIRGTVIKGQSTSLPNDINEWVAAPIVRDAVKVLEEMCVFTFNRFLFSSSYTVCLDYVETQYTNGGLNSALRDYVLSIDTEMKYSKYENVSGKTVSVLLKEYRLSVHRLRHTLSLNLIQADLGIPYITYHLKHVHKGIEAKEKINNVTLSYGGIARELFYSPTAYEQAKYQYFKDLYHPDSPVAGGNKEEFIKRRKEYFEGLMINNDDWGYDDVLELIKSRNAPFADVGLGYCGGKKDLILESGETESPPCIGQLQCNPVDCGNAIIPTSKIPIWVEMYKENIKKSNDPELKYARNENLKFVETAEKVLKNLGINVEGEYNDTSNCK